MKPAFIVCDEAVAALDVSIQAQVLNLFMELRQRLGLTYLFISHDLGVVEHLSDRVAIMYLGRLVEIAPADELFAQPNHPYTQALLAEVPELEATQRTYKPIDGEMPSPLDPPPGCHFHPRCPHAFARCRVERPALKEVGAGPLQRLPPERPRLGLTARAVVERAALGHLAAVLRRDALTIVHSMKQVSRLSCAGVAT